MSPKLLNVKLMVEGHFCEAATIGSLYDVESIVVRIAHWFINGGGRG
jgi:hypothetical protein